MEETLNTEIGIISLCLNCEHFGGNPDYVAKTNKGIQTINQNKYHHCLKYDVSLPLTMSTKTKELVPDIAECKGYKSVK
jgi:hypothetical protein